jgi:GNAT superfamily N-acetyltransferase
LLCGPGDEPTLRHLLRRTLDTLRSRTEVVIAPASYPVQVFGAGLQTWSDEGGKPFLESSLPSEFAGILADVGFEPAGFKRYHRVALNGVAPSCPGSDAITVREFHRPGFVDEVSRIAPILDNTLGRMELCAPLTAEVLRGLVQDLRELVVSGYWLIAESAGDVVGCAFCYPNLTSEFQRMRGQADVADFQLLQQAMDNVREAFLAWLAVDPRWANQGVAARLVRELHGRLAARNCHHVWVSWEISDGQSTPTDVAKLLGRIDRTVDMPFYAGGLAERRVPLAVTGPHFADLKAPGGTSGLSTSAS